MIDFFFRLEPIKNPTTPNQITLEVIKLSISSNKYRTSIFYFLSVVLYRE